MSTLSQRVAKFAGRDKPAVIAALAVAIPVEKDVDVHAMDEFLSPFCRQLFFVALMGLNAKAE